MTRSTISKRRRWRMRGKARAAIRSGLNSDQAKIVARIEGMCLHMCGPNVEMRIEGMLNLASILTASDCRV